VNFTIRSEQTGPGLAVIYLTGEVDLYTAPKLKEELINLIEGGASSLVVDMTETSFIDSTTLGVLISGLKRLGPNGGKLALVITDRNIRKVFEITGLDRVFSIYEEQPQALTAIAEGAT
jgi:anti-sigma B factor antagonist